MSQFTARLLHTSRIVLTSVAVLLALACDDAESEASQAEAESSESSEAGRQSPAKSTPSSSSSSSSRDAGKGAQVVDHLHERRGVGHDHLRCRAVR